ncbi:hypothetical protein IMZ48_21005 [Candidatus Bathyarchaeota archaeon]|nr:hypothetical protein [Candidatus Bathyarchaeota archaeon]
MPFFDVDDKRQFTTAPKVWIYFLSSVVLTLVTFIVSMLWDHLERKRGEKERAEGGEDLRRGNAWRFEPAADQAQEQWNFEQLMAQLYRNEDDVEAGQVQGHGVSNSQRGSCT